jgi:hypothetical protein
MSYYQRSLKILVFFRLGKLYFFNLVCKYPKIKTIRADISNFNTNSFEELLQELSKSYDYWAILKFNEILAAIKK